MIESSQSESTPRRLTLILGVVGTLRISQGHSYRLGIIVTHLPQGDKKGAFYTPGKNHALNGRSDSTPRIHTNFNLLSC